MRTFIAIDFESTTKKEIADYQDKIRSDCKRGNFTYKENLHLTMHFLGEIDRLDADNVVDALDETAAANRKFPMKFTSLGYFDRGESCILWLGIDKSKELVRLYETLEKNLGKQGFRRERAKFTPHITLAREVVLIYNKKLVTEKLKPQFNQMFVNEISLMESKREDGKLIYKKLYSAKLI